MLRRFAPLALLCLAIGAIVRVGPAAAIEVDSELERLLGAKSADERVPVLMIFHGEGRAKAAVPGLDAMGPATRRAVVLDALRERARLENRLVRSVLEESARLGRVASVRELYLADAIVFEATADAVARLADLPDAATLYHDRPWDLTKAARRGSAADDPAFRTKAGDLTYAWNVKYVRAPKVWNELGYDGQGVIIGHVDTGVKKDHTDLQGALWVNPGEIPGNGIDDDRNGYVDDVHGYDFGDEDGDPEDDSQDGGHGTHTAGTLVGGGQGGIHTGVAPGATLMPVKVYRADGSGGTLGTIWAAQQYCVENGARVLSMSLVLSGRIPVTFMRNERFNAANIRDAGVTLFASAGNEFIFYGPPEELGLTARVPAPWNPLPVPHSSTGGVIAVGGLDYQSDLVYPLSSRGPAKWDNVDPWHDWAYNPGPGLIKPDIAAPGVYVNSTVVEGGYSGDTWSGTSMACPHAAGVAALMLQKNPSLSPAGIDSLMELNAVDLGDPGKDNDFGSGRLDAFNAVAAVPTDRRPNLVVADLLPDPDGNAVLEPGRTSTLAFTLDNATDITAGSGVRGGLVIPPNPWVTVTRGEAAFGDLGPRGRADNRDDPFEIAVAAGAPQGYTFTMLLTLTADGGYERTFDRTWYVGLPEYRTHDAGRIYLTVTDQGILGYMGIDKTAGLGMGRIGEDSDLFLGSFWAGTGPDYVCNRDYEGLGAETFEWESSPAEPNGRVRDLGGEKGQMFRAAFTDDGHAEPRGLLVEMTSLAQGGPPDDDYVILEYHLHNRSEVDLPALHAGIYCDFDIADDNSTDMAGTDPARKLTYQFAPRGLYYGIAVLGDGPVANLSVVQNTTYVYPRSHVTDEDKFGLLSGDISEPLGKFENDWSGMVSTAMDLPAGGEGKVAFALVVGENLADLQANVDAAHAAYEAGVTEPGAVPVPRLALAQNQPNPFNPSTRIRFTLETEGPVLLTVFDLKGKAVRRILEEIRGVGDHEVTWDGRDDGGRRLPSGMYLYRLEADGQQRARKMMLLK